MTRTALLILSAVFLGTGLYIFFMPQAFYDNTPGVSMMGPFNLHFIRDAGLAYLASGGAIAWGAWNGSRVAAVCGAAWLGLHGLFHLQIQAARGFPMDVVLATDAFGVMIPAALALWLGNRLRSDAV